MDEGAPGAAVTVALYGHREHEPPCPLAPHHVRVERDGNTLYVRVLFVANPSDEDEVRRRIEAVLAGSWTFPEGFTTPWHVLRSWKEEVALEDTQHAERLLQG